MAESYPSAKSTPTLLTIGTCNRRAGIAVVIESFLRHHPDGQAFVCLVDRPTPDMPALNLPGECFFADQLSLPGGTRFLFKYDAFELCCALKPYALQHIMQHCRISQVVYLDSDILVTGAFWNDLELKWMQHSILVTPHIVRPPRNVSIETQRSMIQHGAYNAGFIGLKKGPESEEFLICWANLLAESCTSDPMNGTFVDQRWLDLLVPSNEDAVALRDVGLNVAYWNLYERELKQANDARWLVNGQALKFFHFSGFHPERLTTKIPCVDAHALALAQEYNRLLQLAGQDIFGHFPYAGAFYHDGTVIPTEHRDLILANVAELADVTDPFALPQRAKTRRRLDQLVETTAPLRIGQRFRESDKASDLLLRLHRHPVLGAVWHLWYRLINPSLQPYLPPYARR